jgi:hypothetical protein
MLKILFSFEYINKMDSSLINRLRQFKLPQLKHIAKVYNLSDRIAYSKLRKAQLVDALHEHLSVHILSQKEAVKPPKQPRLVRTNSIPVPSDEEDRDVRMQQLVRMVAERRAAGKTVSKLIREYEALRNL